MPTRQRFPETPIYLVKAIPCDAAGEVVDLRALLEQVLANQARLEQALKRQGVGAWAGLA